MGISVILLNPPSKSIRKPEEHLGLGYLAAVLRGEGLEVEIIDSFLYSYSVKETINRIKKNINVKIIGISPTIDSFEETKEIVQAIRNDLPGIRILLGGHLATFSYKELLNDLPVDFIVRGEGEVTFLELVRAISANRNDFKNIKGLAFRSGGDIVLTEARELVSSLDKLPFPARDTILQAKKRKAFIHISASRGCYGNCSFCSINSLYKISPLPCGKAFGGWRGRNPKSIVDEIEMLYRDYGATHFKFVDDCFFAPGRNSREMALVFAEEIIKRGIKIRFRISARVNDVEKDLFKRLKDAGLYSLSLGVESGNQRALETFNKGITVEKSVKALKILNDLDLIVMMGFIGFDPYSTMDELRENYVFLKKYSQKCITNKISLALYVHADDPITRTLLSEKIINGRDFPNYTYKIQESSARTIYELLKKWNSNNETLYNKIIDPLSAPRVLSDRGVTKVHRIIRIVRSYDFEAFKYCLDLVKAGGNINCFDDFIIKYHKKWAKLEKEINNIYRKEELET